MKKTNKSLTVGKKLLYILMTAAVVAALSYLTYYLIHFTYSREYTAYLHGYEYEEGSELELEKQE